MFVQCRRRTYFHLVLFVLYVLIIPCCCMLFIYNMYSRTSRRSSLTPFQLFLKLNRSCVLIFIHSTQKSCMLFLVLYIQGDVHIAANNMSSNLPHPVPLGEKQFHGRTCPQGESDVNKVRLRHINKSIKHPC